MRQMVLALPEGFCKCGCGKKTSIATRNRGGKNGQRKWIKGQPIPYLKGHSYHGMAQPSWVPIDSKWCKCCSVVKPKAEFWKRDRKGSRDGLQGVCKECHIKLHSAWVNRNREKLMAYRRKLILKRDYGVEYEEYERIYQVQGGKCAICHMPETALTKGRIKHLHIDHCHTTNKIRGLLCPNCNVAIGMFKEDIRLFKAAIEYLEHHV